MAPDTRHLHSALDSGTQHPTVALSIRQWHSALGSGTGCDFLFWLVASNVTVREADPTAVKAPGPGAGCHC